MKKKQKKMTKKQMQIKIRRRRRAIVVVCLILCVVGIGYATIRSALQKYIEQGDESLIYQNVYIGEDNVGKLSEQEAVALIDARREKYDSLSLKLLVQGQEIPVSFGELGFSIKDVPTKVREAAEVGKEGNMVERALTLNQLSKKEHVIPVQFSIDREKTTAVVAEKVAPLETKAVNATLTRTASGFDVTDEAKGIIVDIEKSVDEIVAYFDNMNKAENGSLAMTAISDEPTVTKEVLGSIEDVIGTFSTDAGTGDRVKNLITGAEKINGTLLMPGDVFSMLEVARPFTIENGYAEGTAFENGEVVPSIGGGICQVSTTLYNAVLYAELEIVERYPHSMIVNYVKPARDAAIADGIKDFIIKNNKETPVYIEAYIADNNELTVHIFGKKTEDTGRRVEYVSETLGTQEPGTKYVADTESSLGSMYGKSSAHMGIDAQLVKVEYLNDEEVSREIENYSYYMAADAVVAVGIKTSNSNAQSMVLNAIYSQNLSRIQEAIAAVQ